MCGKWGNKMHIKGSASVTGGVKNPMTEQSVALDNEQQRIAIPAKSSPSLVPTQQEKVEGRAEQQATEEQVIVAIEKANHKFQYYNTHLEFSIHEKTKEIMVKVYRDDEVIREIPPEKVLDMVAHMLELAGLLVDETV
jgi:flagellar protein FlaG